MSLLEAVVADYLARYGEPEYRYFKKHIAWVKHRRQPGSHFVSIGDDGTEITLAEYEANIAESDRCVREAFMGRLPRSYFRYNKKMVKDGWRETLIRDVQQFGLKTEQGETK